MDKQRVPNDTLEDRVTSGMPLSIGTALAMETLFTPREPVYDPSRVVPDRVDCSDYNYMWFNIRTMFRNMSGAMSPVGNLHTNAKEFAAALANEMSTIESLFSNEGNSMCIPRFYLLSYRKVADKYKQGSIVKFRPNNTKIQQAYAAKESDTIKELKKLVDLDEYDSDIIPERRNKCLIMTHIPYDLLSYKHFSRLDLLESHQGVLKTRLNWNSKFFAVPGASLDNIPFKMKTLGIFGDRIMFSPTDLQLRKLIVDVASNEKGRWNPLTTTEKMMADMRTYIKEPMVLELIGKI